MAVILGVMKQSDQTAEEKLVVAAVRAGPAVQD